MSVYGRNPVETMESVASSKEVMEMFLVDDLLKGTSDQIHEFCESAEAKVLMEKAVLKKPTMMRLSKEDDKKRRIKLMAYTLAKQANDPLWDKLKKNIAMKKQLVNQILNKYGNKAAKLAAIAQKNYIATAQKASTTAKDNAK